MAFTFLASSAIAWAPARIPSTCEFDKMAFDDLKTDGFVPWVISHIFEESVEITMIIWHGKDGDITVTTTRKGSGYTCIAAMGDTDTVILDLPLDHQPEIKH